LIHEKNIIIFLVDPIEKEKKMNSQKPTFHKTDDNRIINEAAIRWVKQMGECLEVCLKTDGCQTPQNTHRICKNINPSSYAILEKHLK
jgi:hypothetical protein